jgi:hypothetical protein
VSAPFEIDTLAGGEGSDTFVLGDNGTVLGIQRGGPEVYYVGGGNSDFARITDFNLSEDVIQLAANPSSTITVAEAGDAGQTLEGAQVIPSGSGTLDSITGAISGNNDVDLFQISLAGGTFSASTVGGASFDTQLFLFNSSGALLLQNDDFNGLQSTISSSSLAAGNYFLAISSFNNDPVGTPPTFPRGGGSSGSYTIDLTGVQAPPATYSLGTSPVSQGTGLFFGGDLIADIQGVSPEQLSLNSNNFVFV